MGTSLLVLDPSPWAFDPNHHIFLSRCLCWHCSSSLVLHLILWHLFLTAIQFVSIPPPCRHGFSQVLLLCRFISSLSSPPGPSETTILGDHYCCQRPQRIVPYAASFSSFPGCNSKVRVLETSEKAQTTLRTSSPSKRWCDHVLHLHRFGHKQP